MKLFSVIMSIFILTMIYVSEADPAMKGSPKEPSNGLNNDAKQVGGSVVPNQVAKNSKPTLRGRRPKSYKFPKDFVFPALENPKQ